MSEKKVPITRASWVLSQATHCLSELLDQIADGNIPSSEKVKQFKKMMSFLPDYMRPSSGEAPGGALPLDQPIWLGWFGARPPFVAAESEEMVSEESHAKFAKALESLGDAARKTIAKLARSQLGAPGDMHDCGNPDCPGGPWSDFCWEHRK